MVSFVEKDAIILEFWQVEVDKSDFNGLTQTYLTSTAGSWVSPETPEPSCIDLAFHT